MKRTIGWIMLAGYYLMFIMGVIVDNNLIYLIGAIFLPMVVIPGTLLLLLFANPISAIFQALWLIAGIYLIASEE